MQHVNCHDENFLAETMALPLEHTMLARQVSSLIVAKCVRPTCLGSRSFRAAAETNKAVGRLRLRDVRACLADGARWAPCDGAQAAYTAHAGVY